MNPLLLKIAKFMAQRPKDRTIRLFHILMGLIIMEILWIAQDRSFLDIPFMGIQAPHREKYIEYGLFVLGIIPLFKGLLPFCLVKHGTLRIAQILLGILLILVGGPIMDPAVKAPTPKPDPAPTTQSAPTWVPVTTTSVFKIDFWTEKVPSSHPGALLVLLGTLWILVWATGKGTTEKCLRYKEVVKKIRV